MVNKKMNDSDEGFAFHVKPIMKDAKKVFKVFDIEYSKSPKDTFRKATEDSKNKKVKLFHIPYRRTSKRVFVPTIDGNWAVFKKLHAEVGRKYNTNSTPLIFDGASLFQAVLVYNKRGKSLSNKILKVKGELVK